MNITDEAFIEIKKAISEFNKPESGIRIFSMAGCCGTSIQMDIVQFIGKEETVISIQGIDFFISNDLVTKLENVTIEFDSNGFRLSGLPNNENCCG